MSSYKLSVSVGVLNHSGHSGAPCDGSVSDLSFSSPSGQLSGSGLAIEGSSGGDPEVSSGHYMVRAFTLFLIPDLAGLFIWTFLGWSTVPDFDVENWESIRSSNALGACVANIWVRAGKGQVGFAFHYVVYLYGSIVARPICLRHSIACQGKMGTFFPCPVWSRLSMLLYA